MMAWAYAKVEHSGVTAAAATMANVAGNGVDAVRRQMKSVGDACKGCHEPFRAPKKK